MSTIKRYIELLRIILTPSGYKRAEYLRKKNYFKKTRRTCLFDSLEIWNGATSDFIWG